MPTVPDPAEPDRPRLRAGAAENPGGSHRPSTEDLTTERREYERHGGDHVARYRWAAPSVRGGRVLDVGCGHGFGAVFLRGTYGEYVGVDLDPEALDWAKRVVEPATPGATFRPSTDLGALGSFDVITCFEVIEHVSDPGGLLSTVQRAAAPGGLVFLSTPNGSLSAGRAEWFLSPFHLAEYTVQQFQAMVAETFRDPGRFLAQRRRDELDWLLPAIRARLLQRDPRASAGRGASGRPTPAGLQRGHAAFRRIPSPPGWWTLDRLPGTPRNLTRASHLLWTGRANGAT